MSKRFGSIVHTVSYIIKKSFVFTFVDICELERLVNSRIVILIELITLITRIAPKAIAV